MEIFILLLGSSTIPPLQTFLSIYFLGGEPNPYFLGGEPNPTPIKKFFQKSWGVATEIVLENIRNFVINHFISGVRIVNKWKLKESKYNAMF